MDSKDGAEVELFVRVIDLEKKITVLQAHVVNIMQIVELLAARLGELVPEKAINPPDDPNPEASPYL
jgi:hypothetical protein